MSIRPETLAILDRIYPPRRHDADVALDALDTALCDAESAADDVTVYVRECVTTGENLGAKETVSADEITTRLDHLDKCLGALRQAHGKAWETTDRAMED